MMTAIELRKELHKIPELMFQEFKTTALLLSAVSQFKNLKIHRPLETGLLIEYTVNSGGYLLFRADIDALPIKEETGVDFSSTNDNMHACGHDIHSAILFGLIDFVSNSMPNKNILFLFQPGEEGGGGALKILESGVLDKFPIEKAFALHVTDEYEKGVIASTAGVLFASAYEVDVQIIGKSAHVAFPENGIHSFDILSEFIVRANGIIAKSTEKLIFGYGKIYSGTARNIIPRLATAECTIRGLSGEKALQYRRDIEDLLNLMVSERPFEYKLKEGSFYTEVVVDSGLFSRYERRLSKKYQFIDCGYKMTGEDFGFISKKYPSFMFWLGTSTGEKFGLHNEKFLPDESIINIGVEIYKEIIAEEVNK